MHTAEQKFPNDMVHECYKWVMKLNFLKYKRFYRWKAAGFKEFVH